MSTIIKEKQKMIGRAVLVAAMLFCIIGIAMPAAAAKKSTVKLGKGKITAAAKSFSVNKKAKTVTINKSGTYAISGNIGDYRILVSKGKLTVTLKLQTVTAVQSKYPCIYSSNSSTTVIVETVKKTSTRLKGPNNFTLASGKKEPDAVIFAAGNLTLRGQGNLYVTDVSGNGKAVVSKKTVYMKGGYCNFSSKKGTLWGDNVTVSGGTFTGSAGDTCIKAEKKINIYGGSITASGVDKGIQGKTGVSISGGSVNVTASYRQGTKFEDFRGITSGVGGKNGSKPIAGSIYISGGTIKVKSYGDCLHSANDVTIRGGNFHLTSTADDGIQAKATLTMTGSPKFTITAKGKKVKGKVKNIASNIKYK